MVTISKPSPGTLHRWSRLAFLLGGGLLVVTTLINGIDLVTSIETQQGVLLSIEGLAGFGGVVISLVGLGCLYPRLADAAPRLARAGVSLAVLPAAFFIALLLGCSILAPQLGFPSLKALVPSFSLVTGVIVGLFAVSVVAFGVAGLHTGAPGWALGGPLLVVATSWGVLFGALQVYPDGIPIWVTFVQTALLAAPLLWIGYQFRSVPAWDVNARWGIDPST